MPFEERDIRAQRAYLEEVVALGARATPVTLIQDGEAETVLVGFDPRRLKAALGLA